MAGYGLDQGDHLSIILETNLLKKGYNVKVINASVSGDTTAGGVNRINWTLRENNIDIFILGLGANDMLRGIKPSATRKNLENIVNIVIGRKIKVILAGMVAPKTYGKKYKKEFDEIFKKLSKKYNLTEVPFLLDGVALVPELNLEDGIHPNKKGIKIISQTLENKIIPLIQ